MLDPEGCQCYACRPVTTYLTSFVIGLGQAQAPQGAPGLMSNILPIVMMVGVFYLLIIRPQGKKAKELQKMLNELKKGDKVVTTGGLLGEISGIKDDEVTLQVQEGVRLRVLRSAVQGLQKSPAAESSKS